MIIYPNSTHPRGNLEQTNKKTQYGLGERGPGKEPIKTPKKQTGQVPTPRGRTISTQPTTKSGMVHVRKGIKSGNGPKPKPNPTPERSP